MNSKEKSSHVDADGVDKFKLDYTKTRNTLESLQNLKKVEIPEAMEGAERRMSEYKFKKNIPEEQELDPEIKNRFMSGVISKERFLSAIEEKLRLIRPSSQADIDYRTKVYRELPTMIADAVHPDLPLRFHGTTIYYTEDILYSGEISSSADRLGVETSYDTGGIISVTTPKSVVVTIEGYTNLLTDLCTIPPGCILVLLPESEVDALAGESMSMVNVNISNNPDRLAYVLTAPENLNKVREWLKDNSHSPEKAVEFFAFAEKMRVLKRQLDEGEVMIGDIVPYKR